jgi:PAS domain S-box-containing protein
MMESPGPQGRTTGHERDLAAILAAARAVMESTVFADAARALLAACKTVLGVEGGFVAVCRPGGDGFDVALLDPGGLELDAAAGVPAPLRRLCDEAARSGRTVFANDLTTEKADPHRSGRRLAPSSALITPILVTGDVAGLLGLADRPGGFSAADSQVTEAIAELAAVAMLRSRSVNGLAKNREALEQELHDGALQLRDAEEKFKVLVENLPDVVARFDPDLRHVYVSPAVHHATGRPARDFAGRTNRELGMPAELVEQWDAALRRVFATAQPENIEFSYSAPDGTRYFDCRLVPEPGPAGAVGTVLSVARDVTERRLAFDAEQRARQVAEALRESTVALSRSLDRETVLTTLLDHLRRIVAFDRASVMLLEEASRLSVRALFDGNRVIPLAPEVRSELNPADHPIVYGILTTGTPVLIPDVRTHPDWSLPTDRSSEASWMGVPLFARGDVAGLFSLSKREPDYFNEEHMRLAGAMAIHASAAVDNAVLFEQVQTSAVQLRLLSRRLVEAQENERRHIARELHDETGQALVSLRFGLRLLEREINGGGSVTGRVAELTQRIDEVIDGLHRLAADLRPPSLDHLGLDAALRQFSRTAASKFGLAVHFSARGFTSDRLPMVVETDLFRVAQEALTNVVRHARATRVDVLAERRGDRVMVMIEDDGVGFDPDRVTGENHFGLLGMRERAEALGGTLTVESTPGAGTTVVVEVPSADPHSDR